MYRFLTRNGQLLAFGLGLLITVLFLISVLGGMEGFDMLAEEEKGATGIFNIGLYGAIVLCILCAAGMLLFGIYNAIIHPKGAVKFLIGLGILLVMFFIFYTMADPVTEEDGKLFTIVQKFEISDGAHSFITGALSTTVTLLFVAAAAFLLSEVRNLFK
ncbi:MAG: hypothetical protein R3275_10310 [Saprospiraceae bacterium]|nr:hypothetical protein [Saprospiraceae bacterium]